MNLENTVREETICRGCGKEKQVGCVVCWDCFKYRTDITPLKYAGLELEVWLKTALRLSLNRQITGEI